jgi:long-chain acyl-CoA synthetase
MTGSWSVAGLLGDLAARGEAPALLQATEDGGIERWSGAQLAAEARAVAAGLRARGVARGEAVALHAPNGPAWAATALGIMAAGAVLLPIDDLAETALAMPMLRAGGARLILTTPAHLESGAAVLAEAGIAAIPLPATGADPDGTLPEIGPEEPAALMATSGTTGNPKAFRLTHRNISANVEAVAALGIVGPTDRVLLPLPLHHAYPLVVGLLTVLTAGSTLVLPASATGPAIIRAARDGEATTIVGVPRLYDAIVQSMEAQIAARPWALRTALRGLIRACATVRRATGLSPGRLLLAPLRTAVAPSLRLLVSGGARLDPATEERLEALGWMVLSGYGLAETASIFTGNRPEARRIGSAGLPFGDGRVRIASPDAAGIGEIELNGSAVTAGYLDNPEANARTFTADGWFRTGDLGRVDAVGFLHVTGRAKEVIVLGGGKKVDPEDIERLYAAPAIEEIAVLERDGALVALIRANQAKLRDAGVTNPRDGVRVVLAGRGRDLPSHERLAGFALTDEPLPRTRLGKFRRFLLPALYDQALEGRPQRAARAPGPEDLALLAEPTAAAVWALLQAREPGRALDLDMNPGLDLSFDSFAWMELTLAMERLGVKMTEADIAGIATLRDLLRLAVARRGAAPAEDAAKPIAVDIDRWLAPTGPLLTAAGVALYGLNLAVMRGAFRLRVAGMEHLPADGPFVITPNHISDLDAMAIAAALPLSRLRRLYWAGDITRLFYNEAARQFCRAVHLFPVDEKHPYSAVEAASRVLASGKAQVWFPEGWRSPDGKLQRFMPGIGQLLLRSGVSAVPAWIDGAYEALPRGKRIPRFHCVSIVFGAPVAAATLREEAAGRNDEERIAAALRARVLALGRDAGFRVETVEDAVA